MGKIDPDKIEEARGASLAAYALSASMLRLLHKKELFSQEDVHSILSGILLSLEQDDALSDPSAYSARVLLSALAEDFHLPLKKPS